MRTSLGSLIIGVLACNHLVRVYGFEKYLNEFPNGDLYKNEDKIIGKSIGHCEETGKKTEFALLLKENNCEWAKVCSLVFPGHSTLTVGEAFGDPCCTWKVGETPDFKLEITSFQKGKPTGTRHKCKKTPEPVPEAYGKQAKEEVTDDTPNVYDEPAPDGYNEQKSEESGEYGNKKVEPNPDENKKTEPVYKDSFATPKDEGYDENKEVQGPPEPKQTDPQVSNEYNIKKVEPAAEKTKETETGYKDEGYNKNNQVQGPKETKSVDKTTITQELKDDVADLQSIYKALGILLEHMIQHTGVKLPGQYPITTKEDPPPPVNPGPNGFGKQPTLKTDTVAINDDAKAKTDNYGASTQDYRERNLRNRLV